MPRILAVDHGTRRIGLAVSDPSGTISMPLRTVAVRGDAQAARDVASAARETQAETIVVGLPLNMDGTSGPAAEHARRFADAVGAAAGVPVVLWDERLTTRMAERMLVEADVRRARRKEVIDKLAAQAILESYLDSLPHAPIPTDPDV